MSRSWAIRPQVARRTRKRPRAQALGVGRSIAKRTGQSETLAARAGRTGSEGRAGRSGKSAAPRPVGLVESRAALPD